MRVSVLANGVVPTRMTLDSPAALVPQSVSLRWGSNRPAAMRASELGSTSAACVSEQHTASRRAARRILAGGALFQTDRGGMRFAAGWVPRADRRRRDSESPSKCTLRRPRACAKTAGGGKASNQTKPKLRADGGFLTVASTGATVTTGAVGRRPSRASRLLGHSTMHHPPWVVVALWRCSYGPAYNKQAFLSLLSSWSGRWLVGGSCTCTARPWCYVA